MLPASMAASGDSAGGSVFTARTPILRQKLYVVIIATVVLVLAAFVLVFVFLRSRSCKRRRAGAKRGAGLIPLVTESDQRGVGENVGEKKVFLVESAVRRVEIESESKKVSSVSNESSTTRSESSSAMSASTDGFGNFGWGKWYGFRELQTATNQFSDENVIGEGGYGVVYRGVLHDGSVVAIKNLSNKR